MQASKKATNAKPNAEVRKRQMDRSPECLRLVDDDGDEYGFTDFQVATGFLGIHVCDKQAFQSREQTRAILVGIRASSHEVGGRCNSLSEL